MPPDADRRDAAAEWLAHARSNLIIAQQPKPAGVRWDHLCFEAQQAAEKAVKAVLVDRGVEFPYIHDIRSLLSLLDEAGQPVPEELWEAGAVLTPYAVLARYPGFDRPVTEDTHRQAVEVAEWVVRWAERMIYGP